MSTFNGLVSEFPEIRIDFFRGHPCRTPPLACFLSHVHSDHLAGLETLRSPFVYCSAATREILLRLEKYTCRINYVRGVLEARQQTYKHLRKVLKALPLETPTTMELRPGYKIQVTLFDANHCPGSTMFFIEGQGKAILYTGDVRAEPWFVNSIARNPILIEYTHGLKTLDNLYLDTSFIEDVPFQTKSDGIADLLRKVKMYPPDTIFHLQAWTFGYEEVWIALSKALNSRIHVDEYKLKIFQSLKSRSSDDPFSADFHLTAGAAALNGHLCGNTQHPGCLTSDQNVRIHSCEKANMCSVAKKAEIIFIRPVVCRLPGGETIMEAGVGGGGKDFSREAELEWIANNDIGELLQFLPNYDSIDNGMREEITAALKAEATSGRQLSLNMTIDEFDDDLSTGLKDALRFLSDKIRQEPSKALSEQENSRRLDGLPKAIFFPFARHSPYQELCHLADIFKPKDIWPCTVGRRWKERGASIQSLFGEFCSEKIFYHDQEMASRPEEYETMPTQEQRTPDLLSSQRSYSDGLGDCRPASVVDVAAPTNVLGANQHRDDSSMMDSSTHAGIGTTTPQELTPYSAAAADAPEKSFRHSHSVLQEITSTTKDVAAFSSRKRLFSDSDDDVGGVQENGERDSQRTNTSVDSASILDTTSRYDAYQAMLSNSTGNGSWTCISLLSTDGNHGLAETEL